MNTLRCAAVAVVLALVAVGPAPHAHADEPTMVELSVSERRHPRALQQALAEQGLSREVAYLPADALDIVREPLARLLPKEEREGLPPSARAYTITPAYGPCAERGAISLFVAFDEKSVVLPADFFPSGRTVFLPRPQGGDPDAFAFVVADPDAAACLLG